MLRRKAVTLQDVAQAAGVTKMAVSVVLNGSKSKARVSDATRIRIQEAAKRLGYRPNAIARSLQAQRTNIIGLFGGRSLNADSPWTANILAGMQRGCAEHGLDLLLHGKFRGDDPVRAEVAYGELANGKIDGVLVLTYANDPLLPMLRQSHLALVALAEPMQGMPSVRCDDDGGFRLLIRHLHQKGHRRVVLRYLQDLAPSTDIRRAAARDEAKKLGMQVAETLFTYERTEPFSPQEEALLDLKRPDRCTALIAWSDHVLAPVMSECRRRGWRVPQDLALAGFDGVRMFMEWPPLWRITSIRSNPGLVARTAVGVLAKVINGEPVPNETIIPVTLDEGETV